MSKQTTPVEVLMFRRGDNVASIATSGIRHVTEECRLVKEHPTLREAISYLEAKGYVILTDNFRSV